MKKMRALALVGGLLILSGCCLYNRPPVASFVFSPVSPTVGDTINFTDQSFDDDGRITSWQWTFGDGAASNQRNPTHLYNAPGTYTVTLTVTDNCGATSSSTATITVSSGGGGGGCYPELQISVWTDKTTYAEGEIVTVFVRFNKYVQATLTLRLPTGATQTLFSNQLFSPGTYQYTGTAGKPLGDRILTLTATDNCGITKTATATYEVGSGVLLPP